MHSARVFADYQHATWEMHHIPWDEFRPDLVLPELASAYLDRSWRRPGMVLRDGVVTRAFASAGWTWGGDFASVSDLMHFSANGR